MMTEIEEQKTRRLDILVGINNGLGNVKIAEGLGVPLWVVIKDLKRMRHNRDSKLVQAYEAASARIKKMRLAVADLPNDRFYSMTGMTLKEKTFSNMMSFYRPELMKILGSDVECDAIRDLTDSVRRTLRNNGIIHNGWKSPQITSKARAYLTNKRGLGEDMDM